MHLWKLFMNLLKTKPNDPSPEVSGFGLGLIHLIQNNLSELLKKNQNEKISTYLINIYEQH